MDKPSQSLRPALLRVVGAIVLLAIAIGFLAYRRSRPEVREQLYNITVIPPTCTASGYSLYTSKENGSTFIDDTVPATGHSFGQWVTETDLDSLQCLTQYRTCTVCGATEENTGYPQLEIPVLALEGSLDGIGKKDEVDMTAEYISEDTNFSCYATLKYQGHESLSYEKKNYTLKLFSDEGHNQKNKLTFSHWNAEHKYILKANYIDPSMCRNLICADIWAEMAACREGLAPQLKDLSNYGAVDGFPIALYLNGEFQGLYTMNLHKDDDLFGMSDGEKQAIMIVNTVSSEEAFFRSESEFSNSSPWEVEYCGTEDAQWAKDKLNELIAFVMESDDETFRADLGRYLDVNSAIDYLISIYALGLSSHGASDLVLVTYGADSPWIASLYDMESAFGLSADGSTALEPSAFLPSRTDSGTGNLLWDRLLRNFFPEIQARYTQLRETLLDPDALCGRVTDYTARIPESLYQADAARYAYPAEDTINSSQITDYISQRIPLLDGILLTGKD